MIWFAGTSVEYACRLPYVVPSLSELRHCGIYFDCLMRLLRVSLRLLALETFHTPLRDNLASPHFCSVQLSRINWRDSEGVIRGRWSFSGTSLSEFLVREA